MNEHINGQARLIISNGGTDFVAALRLWVQQNCQQKAQEIFNDPRLLAAQPFDWVEKNFPNSKDAIDIWREAVENQFYQIGHLIIDELKEIFKVSVGKTQELKISTGMRNKVFANYCPFCKEDRVVITRLMPCEFDLQRTKLKNLFNFLKFSAPDCQHGIPIRDSVWQIIQNQPYVNQHFPHGER